MKKQLLILNVFFVISLFTYSQNPITRQQIMQNASDYLNLQWTMGVNNTQNACYDPIYIRTHFLVDQQVNGMAYCWGKANTIQEFLNGIAGTGKAGNICTTQDWGSPNTYGVDCSGFITRVWERNEPHIGTGQFDPITTVINSADLRRGDILLSVGNHVRLFHSFDPVNPANIIVIDATADGAAWRVIQHTVNLQTQLNNGYVPRRYNNLIEMYIIAGYIEDNLGNNLSGVTVTFSGGLGTVITDINGYYSLDVTPNWSGTVAPSKSGYVFSPNNINFANVTEDYFYQNFIGTINASANFSATPTSVATGSSVAFTDQSTGTPTSWSWSFPGGTPSSYNGQTPPAITYNIAGNYNVSLTVTNTGGSTTETKTNYITVAPGVGANFSYDFDQNYPKTVYFTDISTNNSDTWFWDFGDGTTSTAQNPAHIYTYFNSYTVTLTAGNQYGNTSITNTINIIHPDITISGNVVEGVIGLSDILVQAIDDDGYTTATTISGANGAFELSVPYQWSGTISAVATSYSSVPVSYSNLTYNVNGLLLNLTYVILTINKTQLYGTYYKFEVVGAPTFGTVYNWTFSGPGLNDNYTTSLWWTNEFFECSPTINRNYSLTVTVQTETGETFSANLPIPINHCATVISATTYMNGCSSYRLGEDISFVDISQPFSEISRVVVWYSDGTLETWDTQHCGGFSNCYWPENFQYVANCKIFEHHFASPGVYSASLQAANLSGQPENQYWFGFIIVNCDAVSTNFSNVVSYTNSGIYNFYSGKFDLSTLSYISDYNNKNINLYACNEIVLEPGVTIEPNPGYTVTLQLDPCLQGNSTKSLEENENNEPSYYSENDNNSFIENINAYSNDIKLYPNPNNGKFAVETTNPNIFSIQLYNPIGQLIKSFDNIGKSLYLLNITNYAFGIYYLKVNTESEVKIFKISYSLAQ